MTFLICLFLFCLSAFAAICIHLTNVMFFEFEDDDEAQY